MGRGALQPRLRSIRDVERSCCRGAEPRVHTVPRSRGHEDQVSSDSGTPSLQKYPGLRRQRPSSFDHAQRNALQEGKDVHYNDEYQAEAAPVLTHRLKEGKWFGFAETDIEIPELLRRKFEMCPFFYNKKVPVEAVPQQMLDYLKRTGRNRGDGKKLVGALSAEKLLVYAPLLRWYVDHGW